MELLIWIFIFSALSMGFFPTLWAIIVGIFYILLICTGLYIAWYAFIVAASILVGLYKLFLFAKNKVYIGTKKIPVDTKKISTEKEDVEENIPSVDYFIPERTGQISKFSDDRIPGLMESHDLDEEEAEHVVEIMDEHDLDEDEAIELKDEL